MTDVLEITSSLVSRKVQLINNVPDSLPCIIGDSDRLVQIMYNLIGNAGECMHYGAAARLARMDVGYNLSISTQEASLLNPIIMDKTSSPLRETLISP